MPWIRIEKCVYKKDKKGKKGKKQGCSSSISKAKKYLKALYANSGKLAEQKANKTMGDIVLDVINRTVSNLPMGHKNRNSKFAHDLLDKVYEVIREKDEISLEEAEQIVSKLSSNIKII